MDFKMRMEIDKTSINMGLENLSIIKGDKGDKGEQGDSAYQVALNNGFEGTEQEWLESLKGEAGSYDDTAIQESVSYLNQDVLLLKATTSSLEGQDLLMEERITAIENTIGTLNDSLEVVLNGG